MTDDRLELLRRLIRDVPDFPKPGILFKDITPMLADATGLRASLDLLEERVDRAEVDVIFGMESRGFIFGAALAARLGVGFVPVRKPGRLPVETESVHYGLEYGHDVLEVHKDAISKGQRVLIVDDLIATGGTAAATTELVQRLGGEVAGYAFVIHLAALGGLEKLNCAKVVRLLDY